MTVRQKFTLILFIIGFTLSASPLLLILGSHDLSAVFDCLRVDVMTDVCVRYGNSQLRVLYATFVAGGQQYLFVTVPLGAIMIVTGIILTFVDEHKNLRVGKPDQKKS